VGMHTARLDPRVHNIIMYLRAVHAHLAGPRGEHVRRQLLSLLPAHLAERVPPALDALPPEDSWVVEQTVVRGRPLLAAALEAGVSERSMARYRKRALARLVELVYPTAAPYASSGNFPELGPHP
jgi:hypothetical protein